MRTPISPANERALPEESNGGQNRLFQARGRPAVSSGRVAHQSEMTLERGEATLELPQ